MCGGDIRGGSGGSFFEFWVGLRLCLGAFVGLLGDILMRSLACAETWYSGFYIVMLKLGKLRSQGDEVGRSRILRKQLLPSAKPYSDIYTLHHRVTETARGCYKPVATGDCCQSVAAC